MKAPTFLLEGFFYSWLKCQIKLVEVILFLFFVYSMMLETKSHKS